MILLPLAWTLLTISGLTSGSSQTLTLQEGTVNALYPEILSTQDIECNCGNFACVNAFWYRTVSSENKVKFLGKCNNAGVQTPEKNGDEARFRLMRKTTSFTLRIVNVTREDTGIYSCVLQDSKRHEVWKLGVPLWPGVTPPTLPPKTTTTTTKRPVKPFCPCSKKSSPAPDGCGSLILWPLVGLIAALAVALVSTLYYFSRLPKKCRHRFVKK